MEFVCPICRLAYDDDDVALGQSVTCECGHEFDVASTTSDQLGGASVPEIRDFKTTRSLIGNQVVAHFHCPHCESSLSEKQKELGTIDSCPDCGGMFRLAGEAVENVRQIRQQAEDARQRQKSKKKDRIETESERRAQQRAEMRQKNHEAQPNHGPHPAGCRRCGTRRGIIDALTGDLLSTDAWVCDKCIRLEQNEAQEKQKVLQKRASRVLLTSTPTVQGYVITHYIGIDSVELIIATGLFSEVVTNLQDFFGKKSSLFEGKLRDAKNAAKNALKMLAAAQGANAVVAIDMDYTEFSNNRVALILNGTLVQIEPIQPTAPE